ncbi:MAG: TolC family protein [Dysgonamonadaceae bacterium]|jgi:NodT family efflux transporter outer membrane factor (OMF) lipoprotein|nr:TolC family protein [Dysgonamonadaceae bacterium]
MKRNNNFIFSIIITSVFVSSCQVTNKYKSPDIDAENLYRDITATDTTTIADIPWREYYSEPFLANLIDEALKNNVDMLIAESGIRQAEANLKQAQLAYFPGISLTGTLTHVSTSDANAALNHSSVTPRIGIGATWEADIWGKLNRRSRAQYAQFLRSKSYRDLIRASLIANVATSYYSLLALDEKLNITRETAALLEKNVETMQALKDAGRQNSAAVEQSRSLMLSAKISVFDIEYAIRELENSLCVLLGRKPGAIERGSLDVQPAPMEIRTGVPMQMLVRRPDVRQAELAFRSAFELTNAAQAGFYPSITLNAGSFIGYTKTGFSNLFSVENLVANVIGGLTQPLFAQGQLRANLKIARENQLQALLEFQNTVLNAGSEVSNIMYRFESLEEKAVLRSAQIVSTKKAAEDTEELLKADEAIYTEVLSAQQNYLSARLNEVNDKLEQLQCVVNLYRALGGGEE